MRLFRIVNGKLIPYKELNFGKERLEKELEELIENNPEYLFQDSNVLIIGRQVLTNLNSTIDLLGIDKNGNTVVIELKRGRTPRETLAQILEYASFVENLDYSQLNEIFQHYYGEEISLEEYHQQYFQRTPDEKVSFNKSVKLVIVAQEISREIKQTALFLRRKGIDIYCIEFKYFETEAGEKIISSDFVVGEEEFIRSQVRSLSLPRIDEEKFLNSLDEKGLPVFRKIFEFAKEKGLVFCWGFKGFSLNVDLGNNLINLFYGYPPDSVFKQSIYTGFEGISRKIEGAEEIIELYRQELEKLGFFEKAGSNLKWVIDRFYSEEEVNGFLEVIDRVVELIKEKELK